MNTLQFGKPYLAFLLLTILIPVAVAQQQTTPPVGGGSSGGNTGGNSRPSIPSRPNLPQPQPQPGGQDQQLSMPVQVFILGRVVREDGSPPPYGAVIELNCGGSITREAIVGTNGQFSFQFGGDNRLAQVFPDASQSLDPPLGDSERMVGGNSSSGFYGGDARRQRSRRMIGCEMRAQLSGFRSTILNIMEEPQQGPNEVGTIVLYPNERVQGSLVSVTNLLVPKSARKSAEKARKAVQKRNAAEAEVLYKAAIQEYPKYAEAWFELGALYEGQGKMDDARSAYRESKRVDGMYLKPYMRLAQLAAADQDWRVASDLVEKALELDSINLVEAYFVSALAHFNLREFDLSEKRAKQGQRMDFSNKYPQLCLILANISLVRRDSDNGLKEMKNYLKLAPNAANAAVIRARVRQMEEEASQRAAGPKIVER